MGIFNEQSLDHPFAKGIQGAPGVGFNLTSSGDYDMINKKLRNVGAPSANTDAATKKYVDDNSTGTPSTSRLRVDSNIDMKDQYRILNLKHPVDADEPATKQYSDSRFLDRNGSRTMIGDLSMNNNKIIKLGAPTANDDAANKKYVDDNSTGTSSRLTVDSNIDMKDRYRITNLVAPQDSKDPATKYYVDNTFLDTDGSYPMKGNLNMANNRILNLPNPTGSNQPTPLAFTDLKYLHVAGTNKMTNNLNMDNKKIINLRPPTDSTDGATKKYVDDSKVDGMPLYYAATKYLNLDGTFNKMTGNINMNNNKILNLSTPTSNTDAATKKYVDDNSGSPDLSDYLEKDGSVAMTGNLNVGNNKIVNLSDPTTDQEAANRGWNLGVPTQDNEATTKGYVDNLVHLTAVQPSHYKDEFAYLMSSGAQWTDEMDGGVSLLIKSIGDLPPNKGNFHNYNHKVIYMSIIKNSQGKYIYKMGINFYRLTANTDYTLCLEILNTDYNLWNNTQISVDKGTSKGLSIGNVIVKKLSHRYTDAAGKTQTMYYHRIIVNFRKLSSGNKFFLHILVDILRGGYILSAYPLFFQGVYIIAYGIMGTFSNIDPDKVYDYHTAFDIKPTEVKYNVDINANQKAIKNIKLDRNNDNSAATVALVKELAPHTKNSLYRLYFSEFYDFTDADTYGINIGSFGVMINSLKPNITLPHNKDLITLTVNKTTQNFTILSSFNGKFIVLWLTENLNANVTKASISNYSSTLTIPAVNYNANQRWKFTTEDGVLNKLMYSPNFYDTDSEQFHKVMLQEKLNGSYVM
ncbi:unnamed protein product [Porites evermanni]|uniref:Uncharacterized protein n=1 Tax=Porites evermanni TaxID=104178 RepID=A0ABN8SJA3_9CNID|nr:unnamed protein product [Porites evermanni]